ncbi:MAG: CHRD domain-containing protein [Acidobacteria bacterium]|nr:CHRD domain-containing protein [Acidobacteriota bacterium]
MRRVISVFLSVFFSCAAAAGARMDTLVFQAALSPSNEVPPVPGLGATGAATITIFVNRNEAGAPTSATVDFDVSFSGFPASTNLVGLHIHNGPAGIAGPVVIGTDLSGSRRVITATGTGTISRRVVVGATNATAFRALRGVLNQPHLYYVNLHTTVNPGGAIRGQLAPQLWVFRTLLAPDQEVPAVTGVNAVGVAALTLRARRNAQGVVVSGTVDFEVEYRFPSPVTFTGLHVHRGTEGINGPIVMSSGIGSGNDSVADEDGIGSLLRRVDVAGTDFNGLLALEGILSEPAEFYVNLHTTTHPGGIIRGQLSTDRFAFLSTILPQLEVPPISSQAQGRSLLTARVNRDASGNVTSGTVDFDVDFGFEAGPITLVGLHVHNGREGVNGPVVINSGLGSTLSVDGIGNIRRTVAVDAQDSAALEALRGLVEAPDLYYVNLHTTLHPGGALRTQLEEEVFVHRLTLLPEEEVPPVVALDAMAQATLVTRRARSAQGSSIRGTVDFDVAYRFPGSAIVNGLHVHREAEGANGPIVFNSDANFVVDEDGKGVVFRRAVVSEKTPLLILDEMIQRPELFYVNLHTTVNPAGAVRAQLARHVHHFAQLGGGADFFTSLNVSNASLTSSASGLVFFSNADGTPLDGVVNLPTVPFTIPPGGTLLLNTNSLGALKSGYARIVTADVVVPQITFSIPGLPSFTGGASPSPSERFSAQVVRNPASGAEAGVAVVNVSNQDLRITFRFTSADGLRLVQGPPVLLRSGEQISRLLGELIPELLVGEGRLEIIASDPLPLRSLFGASPGAVRVTATVVQFASGLAKMVTLE